MIGELRTDDKNVLVIGGGISGLLAAYHLDQAGYQVSLHEGGQRWGGLIQTIATPSGLAEAAAHSLLGSPSVWKLLGDLHIPWTPAKRGWKARYVWRGGRLRRFPLTPTELFTALARLAWVKSPAKPKDQITIEDWSNYHLGRAATEWLMRPMVLGIHAALPREVSLKAAFPHLEVPPGKTLLTTLLRQRASGALIAPQDGMQALVEGLVMHLEARLGHRMKLETAHHRIPTDTNVILSVPASSAAQIFEKSHPKVATLLRAVSYTPLVSAALFFRSQAFQRMPRGVGVLIPERVCGLSGILFPAAFEGRVWNNQMTALNCFLGGTRDPERVERSDQEIADSCLKAVEKIFSVREAPVDYRVFKHPAALPLYSPRLLEIHQGLLAALPRGVVLFSNYTGHLSIRGMIEACSTQWRKNESNKTLAG